MLTFVLKRLLYMIPTLIGMSMVSFFIIQMPPGDFLTSLLSAIADSRPPYSRTMTTNAIAATDMKTIVWNAFAQAVLLIPPWTT